ncbi:HD-GYP domain-containing protein [bacterium]|nr:HD-GYP domain-containing protein [bacterium]
MKEMRIEESGLSRELIETINEKLTTSGDYYKNISDALEVLCQRIGAVKGLIKLYSRYDKDFIQDIVWPEGLSTREENDVAQRVLDCGNKPYFHSRGVKDGANHPLMGLPLLNNDYPLGVAVFTGETYDGLRVFLQNDLHNYIPLLIVPAENMLLHRVLIESYLRTIESLAIALEAKDNYTIGHSNMVMAHSLALATEMNLNEASLDAIEIGALMHDIGKIGVRDEILQKEGQLTGDEFEEMKQHPIIGEQILVPLKHEMMDLPRKIVRWHHERMDGSGYPDGVKSDVLPIEVRIVSVADIFEALTSDRPYRKALEIKEAIEIMKKMVPNHIDGDIVKTLEELML